MSKRNPEAKQLSFLPSLDLPESEISFLNSLPEVQRALVQAFSAIEGISYSEAFAILLGRAVEEDIEDRRR